MVAESQVEWVYVSVCTQNIRDRVDAFYIILSILIKLKLTLCGCDYS